MDATGGHTTPELLVGVSVTVSNGFYVLTSVFSVELPGIETDAL
jgi:hypothetical protein